MEKGTHGRNELTFENLSFSGQAKSINGQIRTIEKSIVAHLRKVNTKVNNVVKTRKICVEQLERMINRLNRLK